MPHLVFVGGTKVAMFAQCRLSLLGGLASGATCRETCCMFAVNGCFAGTCIVPESYTSCNNFNFRSVCGTSIHDAIILGDLLR